MQLTKSRKSFQKAIATFSKLSNESSKETAQINIPESWEDFAALCSIKSGGEVRKLTPLYKIQLAIDDAIARHKFVGVLKTRQLGVTESVINRFLYQACRNPAYTAVVFSLGQDESSKIAKRIRYMATSAGIALSTDSVKDLEIEGGGRILFRPSTDNAARSLPSVSALLFDEAAFVKNLESLYAGAVPTTEMVGDAARVIFVSTPNGKLDYFWSLMAANSCQDVEALCEQIRWGKVDGLQAWSEPDGWGKVLAHWRSHEVYSQIPDYLAKIRREKKLPDIKLQREYNLGLTGNVGSVFDEAIVLSAARGTWETKPSPRRLYLAGIDPSFGGGDRFAILIWDVTESPYRLVYEYREGDRSSAYNIAQATKILNHWQPFLTSIEANSGGRVVLDALCQRVRGPRLEGVTTTKASKVDGCDRLTYLLEDNCLLFPPDSGLKLELLNFSREKLEAAPGFTDDSIMATVAAFRWLGEVAPTGFDLWAQLNE